MARIVIGLGAFFTSAHAGAWSDHALLTHQALCRFPLVTTAPPVTVETLDSFVSAQAATLPQVLSDEDVWARDHLAYYRAAPVPAFSSSPANRSSSAPFLEGIRVNPHAKFALFIQDLPGLPTAGATKIAWTEVTTLRGESVAKEQIFTSTPAGSEVSALDVISSASDEPDYGLDIGLWEDSGTAYGVHYAFGSQPFGNPKLENTSQAPFHMGFFHESRLLYTAAPYIRHTYCLYRIHLYAALSRHAFATGHPYWGWRFAGWSLHYVQDLTQPYHAKALPGVGMSRIVWASALDALGFHGPKQDAIQLISNRHFALENYAYHRVHAAYQEARSGDPLLVALSDPVADSPYAPWHDSSPEDEVSLEASNVADDLDALLSESVPSHLVSDPAYVFSEADPHVPDVFEVVGLEPPEVQDRLTNALAGLMQRVGIHSRRLVQFILT